MDSFVEDDMCAFGKECMLFTARISQVSPALSLNAHVGLIDASTMTITRTHKEDRRALLLSTPLSSSQSVV